MLGIDTRWNPPGVVVGLLVQVGRGFGAEDWKKLTAGKPEGLN